MDVVTSELSTFSCLVLGILCGAVVISSPVVELLKRKEVICRFRYYTLPVIVYICLVKPKTHPIISLSASSFVNLLTAYLFLYRPFTWADGSTAHFMW